MADFPKVRSGDVLVIPYADAAWTPVLLKAKAVVSESGGILSHCAIVTREHRIPAVVSVAGALGLREGAKVAVDADNGQVLVLD